MKIMRWIQYSTQSMDKMETMDNPNDNSFGRCGGNGNFLSLRLPVAVISAR